MSENLMDGLFAEMNRVREIIKEYEDPMLRGAGAFASAFMKQSILNAENAIKENDVVKMVSCYKSLKEYEL